MRIKNSETELWVFILFYLIFLHFVHRFYRLKMFLVLILIIIIYILFKVKLATLVEGDLKAPFSLATTPRYRGGHYSVPWNVLLYPWSLPYNAVLSKASSTIFWVFGMTWPGIEPWSSGPLANTLLIRPMIQFNPRLGYTKDSKKW